MTNTSLHEQHAVALSLIRDKIVPLLVLYVVTVARLMFLLWIRVEEWSIIYSHNIVIHHYTGYYTKLLHGMCNKYDAARVVTRVHYC